MRRVTARVAALIIALPIEQGFAQTTQASVDVGGAGLRYADSVNLTAVAVTPDFRFDSRRASLEAVGTLSQFTRGGWSSQGSVATSAFTVPNRMLYFELAGFAGGSYHHDGTRTGEAIASGRVHFSGALAGVFTGGGAGTTWSADGWRTLLLGEIGAWAESGPANAVVSLSPVRVDDTTRYADGQLSFATALDRFDFSVLGGHRWGSELPADLSGPRSWASFSATGWMSASLGVVAAAGTYPVDPTQGFPGGRFVSLAVRLASRRKNSTQQIGSPSSAQTLARDVVEAVDAFQVARDKDGRVMLRVHAPQATQVEIAGDFTGWTALALERAGGGWWSRSLPIGAGNYQMNLRINGDGWTVPPGLLAMKDEFGGPVGLLVIE